MWRLRAPAMAAVLFLAGTAAPALAAEPAPPGCRWQGASGGQILACKDKQGYWRRQGDDEIVGYDPPRPKPRPKPAAPPPPPAVEGATLAPMPPPPEMPNVVRADDEDVTPDAAMTAAPASPTPPEPPTEPTPPMSPLEAFFHWLLQLWRGFTTWLGSLF